jgi:hypothetical protein
MSTVTIQRFRTNLRCEACVESIRPLFDAHPKILQWHADVSTPEKRLDVEGAISAKEVSDLLAQKGYKVLDADMPTSPKATDAPKPGLSRYWPLLLILFYLLGLTFLIEFVNGSFNTMRAMVHFMAGFFLIFSFFKLLNLTAFAQSYCMYDIVAKRWSGWGFLYPFVELLLGIAYLVQFNMIATNIITLVVMVVGTIGVLQSLLAKRTIQCACLGAVFNLPMSWVTLVEDLLMAGMAAGMLAMGMPS